MIPAYGLGVTAEGLMSELSDNKLTNDAGIAIGPILFIIAILGILAAAIAAGSGSFTASTSGESSRTKASAIIEIGQNLKTAFDRVLGNKGFDVDAVVVDTTDTSSDSSLFSPLGGGVSPPSVTLADDPQNDVWLFPLIDVPQLGTGTSGGSRVAVLKVSADVCMDINAKVNALTTLPAAVDLGDFSSTTLISASNSNNWPNELKGKPQGCVLNNNGSSVKHYFYQVIAVR